MEIINIIAEMIVKIIPTTKPNIRSLLFDNDPDFESSVFGITFVIPSSSFAGDNIQDANCADEARSIPNSIISLLLFVQNKAIK